jgi:hypothetical protein
MKISVCYFLHDEADLIEESLASIFNLTKYDIHLSIYLTSGIFNQKVYDIAKLMNVRYGGDLHCKFRNFPSQCANSFLRDSYYVKNFDIAFVGSPDYRFLGVGEFDSFIDKASEFIDNKFYIASTRYINDGAVFQAGIYTKFGIEKIGYLDQNFIPNESSDTDYHYRCSLFYEEDPAQLLNKSYRQDIICKSTHHNHHYYENGSSPPIRNINRYLQNAFIFNPINVAYFKQKWGAAKEYKTPFNNPKYDLRIKWEDVTNPYPCEFFNPITPFF